MKRAHRVVDWFGRWGKTVLGVVGAVVAFGAGFWAFKVEDDPVRVFWLFALGVLGTLLAVIMPVRETRANHKKVRDLEGKLAAARSDLAAAESKEAQAVEDAKRDGRAEARTARATNSDRTAIDSQKARPPAMNGVMSTVNGVWPPSWPPTY